MSRDNKPKYIPISRRKLLELGAAGSVLSVAGCTGQSDSTDTPDTGEPTETDADSEGSTDTSTDSSDSTNSDDSTVSDDSEKEPVEAVYDLRTKNIPTDANWNPWGSKKHPTDMRWVVWGTPYSRLLDGTWIWDQLEEDGYQYDPEEQSVTMKFDDAYTWWNGDPVTAEGLYYNREYNRLYEPEDHDVEENVLVDDYTLKTIYKEPQNPNMVAYVRPINSYIPEVIKPYLDRVKDASSQEEQDEIRKELGERTIDIEELVEKGWGNAMFEVADWSTQRMALEKREDHPYADKTGLEKLNVRLCSEQAVCDQFIVNDELDAGDSTFPPRARERAPDHLQDIVSYGGVAMLQMVLNHNNKHLRKRKFRRALAHLVDNQHIQTNNEKGLVQKTQYGMPPEMAKDWLGEEMMDKFIDYPHRADHEGATSLLNELDYSKEGGNWVDPDGDVVEFSFPAVNWGDEYTLTAKTVSEQLKQFGFEIEFISMDSNTLVEEVYRNNNYDITVNTHYGGYHYHPYDYFIPGSFACNVYDWPGGFEKMKEWIDQGKERSPSNGKKFFPTVPEEVGAKEISGSGKKLDYYELEKGLQTVADEQKEREMVQDLAWHWNFNLPGIEVYQFAEGAWGDTKNFEWPSDTKMKTYRPASYMPNLGEVDVTY